MTDEDRHVATVLGVDPGKRSGLALVELYHSTGTPQNYALLGNFRVRLAVMMTLDQPAYAGALRILLQTMPNVPPSTKLVVSCEKYTVSRITQQSQDTQALEVTGMTEAVLQVLDVPYAMVQYRPSEAKLHFPDAALRELGLEIKHVDDHARDALRHACEWCMRYSKNREQVPVVTG